MSSRSPPASPDAALETSFAHFRTRAMRLAGRTDTPRLVVSPYRFNPLGAHVDHQGGAVLARTLDQYTLLAFWPDETRPAAPRVTLHFDGAVGARDEEVGAGRSAGGAPVAACTFAIVDALNGALDAAGKPGVPDASDDRDDGTTDGDHGDSASGDQASGTSASAERRVRYARAAAAVLDAHARERTGSPLRRGLTGVVHGTLVSAGLSSSASVVLAYLTALAALNGLALDERTRVELVRQVENGHLGLANGVQDQMSIVFGRRNALSRLDVDRLAATHLPDPPTIDEVRWLLCYSGVSRELAAGSGFNTRVAECREAAGALQEGARRLCEVSVTRRDEASLAVLPEVLGRRARHVFGEVQRVQIGSDAWTHGDWRFFGELMNASCASSITQYESGSEWLIALQEIARELPGVFGSRFSGGGFGGCLVMLVAREAVGPVADALLERYLARYPAKAGLARTFVATPERGVRIE